MKRLVVLMITFLMVLCLGACGGNGDDVSQADDTEDTAEIEETGEEEEDSSLGDYTIQY